MTGYHMWVTLLVLQAPSFLHLTEGRMASPIPDRNVKFMTRVFFDLETTGLGRNSHITQMAAVGPHDTFNVYVMPGIPISEGASEATGITLVDGVLHYNGEPVEALDERQAIEDFFTFLQAQDDKKVVLVGHNVNKFDSQVLFATLSRLGLTSELEERITGFLDTLEMFRAVHPGLSSYKQEFLVPHFLNKTYNAHNALGDVEALKELVDDQFPPLEPFTLSIEYLQYQGEAAERAKSLNVLKQRKVLSGYMAGKVAKAGLGLQDLQAAYDADPANGIRDLFTAQGPDGQPRVTSSSRVFQKVTEYFRNNQE